MTPSLLFPQIQQRDRLYEILRDQPSENQPRGLERFASCANETIAIRDKDDLSKIIGYRPFQTCGQRWCPICSSRALWRRKAELSHALSKAQYPVSEPTNVALTLTVKNCHLSNLRETVQGLQAAFLSMMRRAPFRSAFGWLRSTEIPPAQISEGIINPHIHSLVIAPTKEDFSTIKYNLLDRWQSATKRYGLQSQKVECEEAYNVDGWISYIHKPILPVTDEVLSSPSFIRGFERAIRDIRLFDTSSLFRQLRTKLSGA